MTMPNHALITGMNGAVAPALAAALRARGVRVTAWDRVATPPESEAAVRGHIERVRPDVVCHVATGAPEWASWIAGACAAGGVPLLWTGSVSVFGTRHTPPFGVDMEPDATDDYGRYKIECERRVREAFAGAIVARLGWQIGDAPGSNTMVEFLARNAAAKGGVIEASDAWTPSCALLRDSAAAMVWLIERGEGGVYHLEGNRDGLSFFEIASRLARRHGWSVTRTGTPAMDNRMRDDRVPMGQVKDGLGAAY